MIALYRQLRAWYLRRFRGFVEAPRDRAGKPRGTSWQQHPGMVVHCACGHGAHYFSEKDLFIRERSHTDDCNAILCTEGEGILKCDCPIIDARYCWICPECGLGHWMDASPKGKP